MRSADISPILTSVGTVLIKSFTLFALVVSMCGSTFLWLPLSNESKVWKDEQFGAYPDKRLLPTHWVVHTRSGGQYALCT
jgi:hypothetical protein